MANHASAEKRNRQRIKRTLRNRAVKSSVRTLVKKVRTALDAKNREAAQKALGEAVRALDRAATKGVYHAKATSRTVSRLSSAVHKLSGNDKTGNDKTGNDKTRNDKSDAKA